MRPTRQVPRAFRLLTLICLMVCAFASVDGETIWVNNSSGDDGNPGSRDKPLAGIPAALAGMKPGMTLRVTPTDKPYPGDIRVQVGGAPDAPIVIDGQGCTVSGRRRLPAEDWKAEGDGVFSRPMPNNAWGMQRHWEGGFPLVWFEGKPGKNAVSAEALEPHGYFLYKNRKQSKTDPKHNLLYIRLPDGRTPADSDIETIAGEGGIFVNADNVVVRNFICEYGGRDGFSTHRNKGIVFENIEARYFMDQGMSHHGAEVIVRNAHFHHNAGGGVVDVYDTTKARYENCLVESDTWRGGVEFYSGEFEMENCVIRANPKRALTVTRGARATLRNCLLIAPEGEKARGVTMGDDSSLVMESCTLHGFDLGLLGVFAGESRLALRDCAFLRCGTNLILRRRQEADAPEIQLSERVTLAGNLYEPAVFDLALVTPKEGGKGWDTALEHFTADKYAEFATRLGDERSEVRSVPNSESVATLGPLKRKDGQSVGADPALLKSLPSSVGPQSRE